MSASEECKLGDSEHGYAHKVRPETVRDLDYMTSGALSTEPCWGEMKANLRRDSNLKDPGPK